MTFLTYVSKARHNHPEAFWSACLFALIGLGLGIGYWVVSNPQGPFLIEVPASVEVWLGIFASFYLLFELSQLRTNDETARKVSAETEYEFKKSSRASLVELLLKTCQDMKETDFQFTSKELSVILVLIEVVKINLQLLENLVISPTYKRTLALYRSDFLVYRSKLIDGSSIRFDPRGTKKQSANLKDLFQELHIFLTNFENYLISDNGNFTK